MGWGGGSLKALDNNTNTGSTTPIEITVLGLVEREKITSITGTIKPEGLEITSLNRLFTWSFRSLLGQVNQPPVLFRNL
jgi:hypothetical protein